MNILLNLILFSICLIIPFTVFRVLIHRYGKEIPPHWRHGPIMHHMHLGVGVTIIAALVLTTLPEYYQYGIVLLGLGLGIVLDELYATFYVPIEEPAATIIYKSSFKPTMLVILSIIAILWTMYILSQLSELLLFTI